MPIPTPLPTCAPPPEATPSGGETPKAEARAPGAFDVPAISVANAASLAPVRITARSDYSDGPTSLMQFEIDEQGNIRLAVDTPDGLEEWFVIDGVTYAGEAPAEGLTPYQAVEEPQKVSGFADPFDLFAPRGDTDRFATAFPLQAVLWWGTPERTERQGTEPIHGLDAEEFSIAVKPEGAPQEVHVSADRTEDLAAAVSAGDQAPPVTLWVEPESGAILQAEWNVDLPSGALAQYRLDVSPVGVRYRVIEYQEIAGAMIPEQILSVGINYRGEESGNSRVTRIKASVHGKWDPVLFLSPTQIEALEEKDE